jgi:hypothetical protein
MTDTITLPRALIEMLRDSLDYARRFNGASVSAELAALDAALAEPDTKREPATEKQVAEVFKLSGAVYWGHYRNGWRDAERFHGITKEDGK